MRPVHVNVLAVALVTSLITGVSPLAPLYYFGQDLGRVIFGVT